MINKFSNRFNNGKPNKNTWSDDDKRYLKANYALQTVEELAEYFNKTTTQVKDQAARQYLNKRTK